MEVVQYFYNPCIPEAGEGGAWSQGQPGLLPQNKQTELVYAVVFHHPVVRVQSGGPGQGWLWKKEGGRNQAGQP